MSARWLDGKQRLSRLGLLLLSRRFIPYHLLSVVAVLP